MGPPSLHNWRASLIAFSRNFQEKYAAGMADTTSMMRNIPAHSERARAEILAFPDQQLTALAMIPGSRPPVPFTGYGWWIRAFFEVRRLQCPDRMLAERARRNVSGLATGLSGSHLRSCDSRAACHFDHWGSIQENRWKTAVPGGGRFQAMSFAAGFRHKSGLC